LLNVCWGKENSATSSDVSARKQINRMLWKLWKVPGPPWNKFIWRASVLMKFEFCEKCIYLYSWNGVYLDACFQMNKADPDDEYHMLRLVESFTFYGHFCFVTELLGSGLFTMLKQNHFQGFSLVLIGNIFFAYFLHPFLILRLWSNSLSAYVFCIVVILFTLTSNQKIV
jgi:hypothetical protein